MHKKAFTLIELLVVISIIALLMSIVMPALTMSRKAAQKISCLNNLRQISHGLHLFAKDNDDQVITAREMVLTHSLEEAMGSWHIAIVPYLDQQPVRELLQDDYPELWKCPADKDPYPQGFYHCPHKTGMASYCMNGYYRPAADESPELKLGPGGNYKFGQIKQPSSCMLMTETSYSLQIYDAEAAAVKDKNLPSYGHHRKTAAFFHEPMTNLLYVDGHCESLSAIQTLPDEEYIPSNYKNGQYQFWPELSLPNVLQNSSFWGPGY